MITAILQDLRKFLPKLDNVAEDIFFYVGMAQLSITLDVESFLFVPFLFINLLFGLKNLIRSKEKGKCIFVFSRHSCKFVWKSCFKKPKIN